MNKKNYIPAILFAALCLFLSACNDKDTSDQVIQEETTAYTPGQTVTKSFVVDNDTVVKMIDVVVNYGTTEMPALFLVHQSTPKLAEGYELILFPLYKDHLELFMQVWSAEFNLNVNGTPEEKTVAYKHLLSYLVFNEVDPGLLVESVLGKGNELSSVLKMIAVSAKTASSSAASNSVSNDLLFRTYEEGISPEKALSDMKSSESVGDIVSVYKNVKELTNIWVDFVKKNKAVVDAPDNIMSFVNELDTIPSHYTGGTNFKSSDYKLSYDAGIWQAKITYHIEGTYGATHPTIAGSYIPKCNTLSTYVSCKGPSFIVAAKTYYSPAINVGSFEAPAAEMNGKVQVDYGDCCCYRYRAYLNFKINALTGYTKVTK